ncbi:MAG: hypothetical protein ACRD0K_29805 [Egibacteraceae bacterium]
MREQGWMHPDSERIERVQGAVALFTPCHGRRVFFQPDETVPGARLSAVCAEDGRLWFLELVPDEAADSGLRPVWVDSRAALAATDRGS